MCLLYFKMGDYVSARKVCQRLQDMLQNSNVESQQLKKYRILCLRVKVELDADELTMAWNVMEECVNIY
jgi:hypothetical protein